MVDETKMVKNIHHFRTDQGRVQGKLHMQIGRGKVVFPLPVLNQAESVLSVQRNTSGTIT
jgi:hypothetical protein